MIGGFRSFSGGLNLVGDPINRQAFSLDQAAAASGCLVQGGGLCPWPWGGRSVASWESGAIHSIYDYNGQWLMGPEARSYARYGDFLFFTKDEDDPTIWENRHPFEQSPDVLGVSPPSVEQITSISLSLVPELTVKIEELCDSAYLNGLTAYRGLAFSSTETWRHETCRVARQDVTFRSPDVITDLAVGCKLVSSTEYGLSLFQAIVVAVEKYEFVHADNVYKAYCTLSVDASHMLASGIIKDSVWYYCPNTNFESSKKSLTAVTVSGVTVKDFRFKTESWDPTEKAHILQNEDRENIGGYDILNSYFEVAEGEDPLFGRIAVVSPKQDSLNRPLTRGIYNYQITFIDQHGRESAPQPPSITPAVKNIDLRDDKGSQLITLIHTYGSRKKRHKSWWHQWGIKALSIAAIPVLGPLAYPIWLYGYHESNQTVDGNYYRNNEERVERPAQTIERTGDPNESLAVSSYGPIYIMVEGLPIAAARGLGMHRIRIYRTLADGGDYYFLKDIKLDEVEDDYKFIDFTTDYVLVGNPLMDSEENFDPVWRTQPQNPGVWGKVGGKYLTEHLGHLWLAQEDRVYYSRPGMPHAWPALNWFQVGTTVTGLASTGGVLFVFTSQGVWRLMGATESDFRLERVPSEAGCLSNRTITTVSGLLMWVSGAGPVMYDGVIARLVAPLTLGAVPAWETTQFVVAASGVYYIFLANGECFGLDMARNAKVLYHVDQFTGRGDARVWHTWRVVDGVFIPGYWEVIRGAGPDWIPTSGGRREEDDQVFLGTTTGEIVALTGSDRQFDYLTALDEGGLPGVMKTFTQIKVTWSPGTSLRVLTFIDDRQVADFTVTQGGTTSRYLPPSANLRGYSIQFQLIGDGTVHQVTWTAQELNP